MTDLDEITVAIEAMYQDRSITDFRLLSLIEMVVGYLKGQEEAAR
jgi:hypothetical protein